MTQKGGKKEYLLSAGILAGLAIFVLSWSYGWQFILIGGVLAVACTIYLIEIWTSQALHYYLHE